MYCPYAILCLKSLTGKWQLQVILGKTNVKFSGAQHPNFRANYFSVLKTLHMTGQGQYLACQHFYFLALRNSYKRKCGKCSLIHELQSRTSSIYLKINTGMQWCKFFISPCHCCMMCLFNTLHCVLQVSYC